jgi:hypothetical protein
VVDASGFHVRCLASPMPCALRATAVRFAPVFRWEHFGLPRARRTACAFMRSTIGQLLRSPAGNIYAARAPRMHVAQREAPTDRL